MNDKYKKRAMKNKKFLKKISIFLVSLIMTFLSVGTAFAAPDYSTIQDQSYWRYWEYPGTGYANGESNIETVNNFEVHRQCTRGSGLSSRKCKVDIVGTQACREDVIVCNVDGVKLNQRDIWQDTDGDGVQEHQGMTGNGNPYNNSSKADNLAEEEEAEYCDRTENYCPGYEDPGNSDYAVDQDTRAWDALQSGDIGGFLCHSLAADTEGFFGCEDEGAGPEFILPLESTTFTQFNQTGLNAPSSAGYSSGLTQNKGIREYVLNVVNFVLGFLGLAAVVAVIYGGFIYVTAGGDESKTEKGKNSVIYAIIGILLILGAYAIVRTVICFAPVGGDDQPSFCKVGSGTVQVSGDMELTEDLGGSVQTTYESAHQRLRDIGEGAMQVSMHYENAVSAAGYLPTIEYAFQDGIDEGTRVLSTLKRTLSDFPRTLEDVDFMINFLATESPITQARIQFARALYTNILVGGPVQTVIVPPSSFADAYELMDYYEVKLADAAERDYEDNIEKYKRYADSLVKLFSAMTDASGVDRGVKDEMQDVYDVLELLKVNKADRHYMTELIKEINEAAELVENLEFVSVRLNSSVRTCTAPCVALFDSLGSIDPSGKTIVDSKHEWDLDGDGDFDGVSLEGVTNCAETNTATVSCVYNSPGTYVVTLKIDSSDPQTYASGIAIGKVQVTRPLSQIKVDVVSNTNLPVEIVDYTDTPATINGRAKFTLEEAKDGLEFDASGSLGSSGSPINEFIWDFQGEEFAGSSGTQDYEFTQKGTYKIMLEVVENNVSEKIALFVEIGSPSSNFAILGEDTGEFQTGQAISFDGTYSKSDNGAITEYLWRVEKDNQEQATGTEGLWSYTPDAPGEYEVTLQVVDAVGERDSNTRTFQVESQKPQACFTYAFENDAQPGTATFRDCSTDPDGDELEYLWEISNGEFVDGTDATSEEPVFKFNQKGLHTVSLTVNDGYTEPLRQEDTSEQDIQVDSILDIVLDLPDGIAYQLSEKSGLAEVNFNVVSENAVGFEIDYADGDEDGENGVNEMAFSHIYSEAGVYKVKATVFDADDEDNSVMKKIFIGEADEPLPVLELKSNGNIIDTSVDPIQIPRETSITFDGSDSLNTDGTGRKLLYLINYGDGSIGSQSSTNHIYQDTGTYEITFTVTDEDTGTYGSIPLTLEVIDVPPVIHSLSSNITSGSLETPVDISASVDAEDIDGNIVQYTWSLFDADNTSNVLETQVSSSAQTIFNFHGIGTTGEEHRVGICVKVKDDGDNEVDSCTDGPYTYTVTVTGENEPPRARFSVADNNVQVGDPVIFYDESTDDNEIVEIYYDVLGNGFADDQATSESSFSHIYERIGTYQTRIKVLDANGAASSYGPIPVIVNSSVDEPVAKIKYEAQDLTINFRDLSDIDPETTLEGRIWDFDTSEDTDGDGISNNDEDSVEENPSHTYDIAGDYEVQLTIKDAQGNEDFVTKRITVESEPLEARLLLTPTPSFDNIVHLQGERAEVRADVSASSGPIVRYVIDGNIHYESGGDDDPGNDTDYDFTEPREGLFIYESHWDQPFTIKLTVYDAAGNSDSVAKKIVFDTPPEPPVSGNEAP